jgi:hypothetical protein
VLGVAGKTVGTVGTGDVARALGNTPTVGIAGAELTPRLPISMAPNGIPVRVPPPVVGDMDVGVDDEAMLLDPEPHIPDDPDVSSIPDVADIPDVAVLPAAAAVAGAEVPAAVPPPS